MQNKKYEMLLAAVIAARATSFIFNKMVLESMEVFNLLAVRFIAAFALLLIIFFKRLAKIKRSEIISGAAIGVMFFLVMAAEMTALKTTDSSTVSLLENCSIIFVPLFEAVLLRKMPDKMGLLCAAVALLGVFCLSAQAGSLSRGMLFGLLAAVLYAAAIILTAKVTHNSADSFRIGIVQVGTMALLSLVSSLLFESPHLPANTSQWLMIALLAVVCTGFGFTLQPVAQSRVSAQRAGVFCAISPAVSVVLGAAVLHERFGPLSAAGLVLIIFSIVLPYIHFSPHKGKQ